MTKITHLLAAAAFAGGIAVPAAAQYPYPYPQPQPQPYPYPQQTYPYPQQYPQQAYPYPGYPQNQSVVGQIIDQLIGNRYNVTDRQAIHSCGYSAVQRAQAQYGAYANPYGGQPYGGYNGQYPQAQQGYPGYMRVAAITEVSRRSGGLRVRGLIDSGLYRNRLRAAGDLSFRCNVNYNGYVTSIRVERNYNRGY
jgi:hypothetical protein